MENEIRVINAQGDVKFVTEHVARSRALQTQGYWIENLSPFPVLDNETKEETIVETLVSDSEFNPLEQSVDERDSMTKQEIVDALKAAGEKFNALAKKEDLLKQLKSL